MLCAFSRLPVPGMQDHSCCVLFVACQSQACKTVLVILPLSPASPWHARPFFMHARDPAEVEEHAIAMMHHLAALSVPLSETVYNTSIGSVLPLLEQYC